MKNRDISIALAGKWSFEFDHDDQGVSENWFERSLADTIELPGTTDDNQKGEDNLERETLRLTRVHPYIGSAFYQKEVHIPEECQGKRLFFRIERTKHSMVWIDDRLMGERDSLCTSHVYEVTEQLTPGNHRLTVRIDNSNLPPVGDCHQTSEHTQTNWNGLLGIIEIFARDACFIGDLQAYPDARNRKVKLCLRLNVKCSGQLKVSASAENAPKEHEVEQTFAEFTTDERGCAEVVINLGEGMQSWDEFNPTLYRLEVSFENADSYDCRELRIGMRDFSANGSQFQINGHTTFLRGKHDACVFPLTGYAPMDAEEWKRILKTAKSYGINHYRFHSWCPPKAAFEAADEIGIYMQPELPLWEFLGACNVDPMGDVEFRGSGDDSVLDARIRYLTAEGLRILTEFGNHASFCMFALGNELGGDLDLMASFVRRFRKEDPRHLYAHGSNNFIREPTKGPADDYWTTMMTGGHYSAGDFKPDSKGREVRGSFCVHTHGHVNNRLPGTEADFSSALKDVEIPVIGHEVGQYQVFPNFDEITKYSGVLQARNFEVLRENLDKAGMLALANEFFRASGALSVICYREDIEAAIRTPGFGGFQLLDLQDFPGQGTALVGILDAFMDSKGLITPEAWREFCNDVVVLAKFRKYTWTRDETLVIEPCVADYSKLSVRSIPLCWSLRAPGGVMVASGQVSAVKDNTNPIPYERIEVPLDGVKCPQQLELIVSLEGTDYRNHYPIWVYDTDVERASQSKTIHLTQSFDDDAMTALASGGNVLLCPGNEDIAQSIPGAFQTDFWCYPMFKKYSPPGTMGILCDPDHPALKNFPTESHSNWQWWSLLRNGCAMILDDLPGDLQPIVRVIDNCERNHRLGVVFECRVGDGKLIICSCDLLGQQEYPEARQLLKSLLGYMTSGPFEPSVKVLHSAVEEMFTRTMPDKKK